MTIILKDKTSYSYVDWIWFSNTQVRFKIFGKDHFVNIEDLDKIVS